MVELVYAKKRLEPIIKKFNIDVENDKVFKAIILLFKGQTDYQIWALKAVFSHAASLDTIAQIKEWSEANPTEISHLSLQNIVSYKTKVEIIILLREMASLDAMHVVKNFINKFNTDQRRIIKENVLDPISNAYSSLTFDQFKSFFNLAKGFETLPQHRQQKFISLMSAVTSFPSIVKHLNNALEESYEWNREDMLSFAQRNCPDTEVVYDKDNVVIIRVPSFESSSKLCGSGRTAWCLTRDKSYFQRYTAENDHAQQFFLFDFNKRENHDLAHVGFSVNPKRGINYAHSTRNNNLMGTVSVDGRNWNINDVLQHHNISKEVYIRLKKLVNYKWDKTDFLLKMDDMGVKVTELPDGRIIVPCENRSIKQFILQHTLSSDVSDNNGKSFVVLDFTKDVNNDKSILLFIFSKDKYETLSFSKLYDPYCVVASNPSVLGENKLTSDMFVKTNIIDPNILLHKLIDECNTEAAIKLLSENEQIDPNFVFYASMPAVKAITNGDEKLFNALVNHPNFDITLTEGFGEPYSHFLILTMETKLCEKGVNLQSWIDMCMSILENPKYNINCLNINDDTTLHCACEQPEFIQIVKYLVNRDDVDVNLVNDWGFRPIDVALDLEKVNIEAIKCLLTREDLILTDETRNVAKTKNIDLDKLREHVLKNQKASNSKKEESKYADIFAKANKQS